MKRLLMVAMLVALGAGIALAAVPMKINVQGVVTGLTGTQSLRFVIDKNVATSWLTVWDGTRSCVIDAKGFFSVALEGTDSTMRVIDQNTFDGGLLGVRMHIFHGTSPIGHQQFSSVPFAFRAAVADRAVTAESLSSTAGGAYVKAAGDTMFGNLSIGSGKDLQIVEQPTGSPPTSIRIYALNNKNAVLNLETWNGMVSPSVKSNILTINSLGSVGIGTTSPTAKFEVVGSETLDNDPVAKFGTSGLRANSVQVANSGGNTSIFVARAAGNFVPGTAAGDGGVRVATGKNLLFGDSGSARMTLLSSGNVGIGTTTPSAKLEIGGPRSSVLAGYSSTDVGGTYYYGLKVTGETIAISAAGGLTGLSVSGINYGIYSEGGKNYFYGNVGVGALNPDSALHVKSLANNDTGGIVVEGKNSGYKLKLYNMEGATDGSNPRCLISAYQGTTVTTRPDLVILGDPSKKIIISGSPTTSITNNLGIGTAEPAARLHVNGDMIVGNGDSPFKVKRFSETIPANMTTRDFQLGITKNIIGVSAFAQVPATSSLLWKAIPVANIIYNGSISVINTTGGDLLGGSLRVINPYTTSTMGSKVNVIVFYTDS